MRHYKKHTDRGTFSRETMLEAVRVVIDNNAKIKPTAREFGLNYKTLGRYVAVKRSGGSLDNASFGYTTPRKVFSDQLEQELVNYAIKASKIFYGLTITDMRQLAYEYAKANEVTVPDSWKENKSAGKDWAEKFMKRHANSLSLRTPEPTSLQRMACFNKENVKHFYDNLSSVVEKKGFTPDRIFNCDETGCTTVQKPRKQIVEKGTKRVGSVVSQEKGTLVTMCATINAVGNSLPPFCVFPRVHTQELWEAFLPTGSRAEGHPRATGWMTTENFLSYLKHFVKFARPTKEQPILLLLDNHQSHITGEAIQFCKENNISLVSFPPHCSHELQPLDKSVFGPFKTFYNEAADNWMRDPINAGKAISIHTIPKLVNYAYEKAFTPANILSAFRSTGISPFDRHVIPEDRYLPSFTTDRPFPNNPETEEAPTEAQRKPEEAPTEAQRETEEAPNEGQKETEKAPNTAQLDQTSTGTVVLPEAIRPFGKAPPRNLQRKRKAGKSTIYTATPEKDATEPQASDRKKCARKIIVEESSESEDEEQMILDDNSDDDYSTDEDETQTIKSPSITDIEEGDYLLTQFKAKKSTRYYIGKVESVDVTDNTIDAMFLKRKPTKDKNLFLFSFPENLDAAEVPISDVIYKLPPPLSGGTKRTGDILSFQSSFLDNFPNQIM